MKPGARALAVLSCLLLVSAAPPKRARENAIRVCDDVQAPISLNPYRIFSEKTHILVQQIFEGLLRFDAEGNFEPVLATRWERIDPLRMRFYLRPGVVFHNGEPVTADMVKRSIERYNDPAISSPAAGFLSPIARVEVRDENTVDIVTTSPDGLILNRLAAWAYVCPMDTLLAAGDDCFGQNPIGTGPFKFSDMREHSIELKAFPEYWDSRFPKVKTLTFDYIPTEQQVDALLKGEIDILTSLPGTRTLEVQRHPGTYVLKKPTLYTVAASFNVSRKPMSSKRVRQALNMGINKDDLIRYDLLGNGRTLATLSSPGEFGHNPKLKPYPYNPARARQILKEEGYPNGFTANVFLKINAQRTGRIIAQQLEKIGVHLNFTLVPDAEIFKYLQDPGHWDMLLADCPDPMYHSAFIPTAFLYSRSPFRISENPEFDRRLENALQSLDPAEQNVAMQELDKFIYDDALALFTYQRTRTYGVNRAIQFTPYTSGMPFFFATSRSDVNK